MRVKPPAPNSTKTLVPLSEVNPGRLVELEAPDGSKEVYMVGRHTKVETNISRLPGKRLLINQSTGRIVNKSEHLLVAPLSATAETYYHV